MKLFIQVNIAEESHKSGILLNDLNNFYNYCTKELSLNIIGLMVLPPINQDSNKYFEILKKKSKELNLHDLSMGMSADYEQALINESTFLRLGTAIFGARNLQLIIIFVFLLIEGSIFKKSIFVIATHPSVGLYFLSVK